MPRGRPAGSKNKPKEDTGVVANTNVPIANGSKGITKAEEKRL